MIRAGPLMGCTYSRLGATLGSPKLHLLSLLPRFCPLSPLYPPCSPGSYPLTCPPSPACCCVPRPSSNTCKEDFPPPIYTVPLCVRQDSKAQPLSPQTISQSPFIHRLDNARNSRRTLTWDSHL